MNICYDESFWEEFEILMFDRNRMSETETDVINIIKLLNIKKDSELLDVCCGFGRYSNFLAENKINVTGIDITKSYIDRAIKERTNSNNPNFIQDDILKLDIRNKYDFAINMFTSFGLLESEDDEITALNNVYNSLKSGGKYLIDIQGKELLCRDFEKYIWFESGDTKVFLEYEILESFTLLKSRWLYYKDNTMHERTFNTRIYSALELAAMVYGIGFKTVEIYGDLEGNEYNMNAKRLIVVGTK
ncbi:MAG: class I SAM-dependent methyltransferase [Spirochaetales bacterium]|nr:class I SAM-dependent methyltransferase [Spirochaetales bacterium]